MEFHEPVSSLDTAALLEMLKSGVHSRFLRRLHKEGRSSSWLAPLLPEIIDKLCMVLAEPGKDHTELPNMGANVSMLSLVSELNILRETLGSFPASHRDLDRMNHFLNRCLEAAAGTHEHIERDARQRLFDFFQLIPTPVCVLMGEEKRVTFANTCFEEFIEREALGKTLLEIFTAEELASYMPYIDSVLVTGRPCFVKEQQVSPTVGRGDRLRWVDSGYYPLGDVGASPPGVIVLHYEVTDRVHHRSRQEHSERRLKQTEEQLIRAMNVSKVGFFDWDMNQPLIHLNQQMRTDWGTDAETLTYEELRALIHPEDLEQVEAEGRRAISERTPFACQCRVVRPYDGGIVWIEVEGEYTFDDDNHPLRFFGTSRDITERKESELKLLAEKHKFESIFRDAPAPMGLWTGPDMVCELLNPEFERFYTGREIMGRSLWEALPELVDQPLYGEIRRVYETGKTFSASEYLLKLARTKDGPLENTYLDLSLTPIHDEKGGIYGVVTHTVNVTDKVLAREEALAASLSKSHFLANMSHEIRTPLAAILGFSALLRDPQLPPSEREVFVDTIVRNGQALTRIIDDILDLAKVESGRLEIERLDFSLSELIDEVLLLFKEKAHQKGLHLAAHIAKEVPDRLASDPLRLRQILVNLVGNAVKFTSRGSVQVHCWARKTADGYAITMNVQDTGIGLNHEQIARLFQPFVQAEHSTTRQFGGTGLGLALSQRLAEALGGEISIPKSTPGVGSTFRLRFRAFEASSKQKPQVHLPPLVPDAFQLRGVRVLAVDDSPDNLFLVKNFLAKSGAFVATATGGRHALDLAESQPFDIILLDIQMPELDGYQTIRMLREQDFHKPVVALTAHAMADERHHTQEAGFSAHLTKPLDAVELVSTVAGLVHCSSSLWMGEDMTKQDTRG